VFLLSTEIIRKVEENQEVGKVQEQRRGGSSSSIFFSFSQLLQLSSELEIFFNALYLKNKKT
jgi:hypothetical protein